MKIGSIKENKEFEKRIAITPDIVKKYISLGFEVTLSESYGSHIGINDKEFLDLGVKISKDENEILKNSNLIVQLGMISDEKISLIKENTILIGALNPYKKQRKIRKSRKKNKCFFSRAITQNNKSSINGYTIIPS